MNRLNMRNLKHVLLFTPLIMALAACASTAPARFYTLSSSKQAALQTKQATSTDMDMRIDVRPVKVPERFKRAQIVLSSANSAELSLLENDRWSASLDDELHDAILSELTRLMVQSKVASKTASHKNYRISVELRQLEAIKSQAVSADFSWKLVDLSAPVDAANPSLCLIQLNQNAGDTVESIVLSMQKIVFELSRHIAEQINSLQAGNSVGCS